MSTITLFKLVSGEEIIATVTDDRTPSTITVEKARAIAVVQTGPQQYGLQLFPFLKGAPDEEFDLYIHSIIGQLPAPADLERSYISQTSGIEIATSLSPLLG
jgi:hypothetical protein